MAICEDDVDIDRDRDLVCRFQAGDIEAFDALYVRYFARLTRFCAKRLEDPSDAEELAQEAFARAFRALPRLKGEQRFYPWLTVIAARVCVDQYRSRCRAAKVPKFEDRGVDGGQDAVFDEVDRAHVTAAMQQLRPRHRDVLRLREEMGWTYNTIAEHYDVSVGTVQLLIFRARHALRREFHAIAGDRASAAFPVFAFMARYLRTLAVRARRGGKVLDGMPAFLQPVAALAVIVGATVIVLGVPDTSIPQVRGASTTPPIATAVATTDAATHAPASAGSSTPSRPETIQVDLGGAVRDYSYEEGARRSDSKPIRAKVGDNHVGADPETAGEDAVHTVEGWMGDAGVTP